MTRPHFKPCCRWIYHWVCDAWPVQHQTYGYLPCHRASPLVGQYQTVLLGDRGTCVWTICSGSLREVEQPGLEPATYWLQVRCTNHNVTSPQAMHTYPNNFLCITSNSLPGVDFFLAALCEKFLVRCLLRSSYLHNLSVTFLLSHSKNFTRLQSQLLFSVMCNWFLVYFRFATVGLAWWDWSFTWWTDQLLPFSAWHCWLGHLTRKNRPQYDL